jgi:hypothetical protein
MFGKKRKLVPTRWSITATDDIISKSLVSEILDYELIDSYKVFSFNHLGNLFSIILIPHRWLFEMVEAWYDDKGQIGFGSDFEDGRGIDHYPTISGAYFAAKLGVAEYLSKNKIQAAVLVLREIRTDYAIPVGVWQVREGIRFAMRNNPLSVSNLDDGIFHACKSMSISKLEWIAKGQLIKKLKQKIITDFF